MLIRGVDRSDRQREPAQTLRAALEADEALREKLLACDELDEMAALLAGHGVEVTSQELVSLGRALPPPDEELGEDDLEEVAGGAIGDGSLSGIIKAVKDWVLSLFED